MIHESEISALLAFHADVELRRQDRPGLLQLIADLMQQDDRRLQLERIRAWMEANGLKDFYARSIAQPARFPVGCNDIASAFSVMSRESRIAC